MQKRIIECVPNFSEGRNMEVIRHITDAIEAVKGVKLLDVDPGEATNRTVVTFVGEPEAVIGAAVAGVKRATELIDMRLHKGAHPRMGACDVCPLIPVSGITMEECAGLARHLAKRLADELGVPTYCYEANITLANAFEIADDVLRRGVQSVSELINVPGFVNLDFADVTTIMKNAGYAHMGVGRAKGSDKAQLAAMAAISSPLLETSIAGATGVLVSITASEDIQLDEVEIASQMIHEEAHPDATIIWGAAFDPNLVDEIKVTIIATGFINNGTTETVTVKKTTAIETPVVTTPAQPVVEPKVEPAVAPEVTPVVTPVATPVVTVTTVQPEPAETPAKEVDTFDADIKKADDILASYMSDYDTDFVFLKKTKR